MPPKPPTSLSAPHAEWVGLWVSTSRDIDLLFCSRASRDTPILYPHLAITVTWLLSWKMMNLFPAWNFCRMMSFVDLLGLCWLYMKPLQCHSPANSDHPCVSHLAGNGTTPGLDVVLPLGWSHIPSLHQASHGHVCIAGRCTSSHICKSLWNNDNVESRGAVLPLDRALNVCLPSVRPRSRDSAQSQGHPSRSPFCRPVLATMVHLLLLQVLCDLQ